MALFTAPTEQSSKAPSIAPLLEAGGYPARVARIIDLGKQPGSQNFPEPQYKMLITFELLDEFMKEVGEDGNPIMVQDPDEDEGVLMQKDLLDKPRWFDFEFSYNPDGYMGENSHLYKFMKAVDAFAVPANPEQGIAGHEAKQLIDLLGEPLTVTLIQKATKSGKNAGKLGNRISAFSPMKSKDKKSARPLVNETVFFNLGEPDVTVFAKLPGGDNPYAIKNRILSNLEFNGSALQKALGQEPTNEPVTNTATDEQVDEAMKAELEAQRLAREAQAQNQPAGVEAGGQPF